MTGAAGFIGSHFVDYVLENHPEDMVIGFDCLTYAGNMQNLESALPSNRFEFIKGDIRNSDEVVTVMTKVDAIVNFAAESHVDRSISSSSEFISTNVLGTNVLLEAAIKFPSIVFYQVSTDEVYGSIDQGLSSECDKLEPRSPYAASKASADLMVMAFGSTHDLDFRISRASNNYGTRQFPEKLIPVAITKLLKNEKMPIYGKGLNIRDWLYVKDHVRAISEILHNSKKSLIYNIGGDELLTNLEVANILIKFASKKQEMIEFVDDRKGHDFRYALSNNLIKNDFNFEPTSKLIDCLPELFEYYKLQLIDLVDQ